MADHRQYSYGRKRSLHSAESVGVGSFHSYNFLYDLGYFLALPHKMWHDHYELSVIVVPCSELSVSFFFHRHHIQKYFGTLRSTLRSFTQSLTWTPSNGCNSLLDLMKHFLCILFCYKTCLISVIRTEILPNSD